MRLLRGGGAAPCGAGAAAAGLLMVGLRGGGVGFGGVFFESWVGNFPAEGFWVRVCGDWLLLLVGLADVRGLDEDEDI